MRYVLIVCYDGTNYGGWQIQKNSITVQGKLELAASDLFGRRVHIMASGRTDAGVHAAAQVCHMDAETDIPAEKIADALNVRLPDDISVLASFAAPENFDATRSAKRKTYCYNLYLAPKRIPLKDRYSVRIKGGLNYEKLAYICKFFEGEHDFKAYSKSGSSAKTTIRSIYSVTISKDINEFSEDIKISVTGNGFLYNMVRTIVGTAIAFAQGSITQEEVVRSLEEGDREAVGKTMPPQGLTLESVDYGDILPDFHKSFSDSTNK